MGFAVFHNPIGAFRRKADYKYEENLLQIHALELQLAMLTEEAEKGHTDEEIEKTNKKQH